MTTSSTTSLRKRKSDLSPDGATTNKQPTLRKSTSNASSVSSRPSRQGSLTKVCDIIIKLSHEHFKFLREFLFLLVHEHLGISLNASTFDSFYRDYLYREASPTRPASRLLLAASSPPPWRVRIPASPPPVHNPSP